MAKTVGKRRPATGRPSKYDAGFCAEFPELARKLALLGATDAQMAKVFGVALSSLSEWKVKHPEFTKAMNDGKLIADGAVASALFHRAMGYEHAEVDIRVIDGQIVQTPIRKIYPPDTTACIFWLKNRDRANWRDKVEAGITDADGKDVSPTDPMEAIRRLAFLLHKGAQAS